MQFEFLVLYFALCGTFCFPTRPLNDRPLELATWQAWLLIDSQNSNEGDRRITPKSVFIAPNIGDGSNLPDCAEGYRSDPMGRCVKFVKVDEAAHLDFLLQRLNALYATRNSEDFDDDVKPTTGPLQVNIPLEDKEEDIAIIVAPTNGQFDEKDINKRTEEQTTEKEIDKRKEEETITEIAEEQTTAETTTENLQALFFLLPNKTTTITTTTDEPETTTITETTTPETHELSSSEIELLFKEYISQKPEFDQIQIPRPVYNHRNRDKNDFWRPVEPQKPLVLRFNRPYSQEQEFYGDEFVRKRRRFR